MTVGKEEIKKDVAHSSYSNAGSAIGAAVVSVMVIAMKASTKRLVNERENCIVIRERSEKRYMIKVVVN